MNFTSVIADRYASFTELTTTNGYLSTKFRHKEDQIRALHAELCNLNIVVETRTTDAEKNQGSTSIFT